MPGLIAIACAAPAVAQELPPALQGHLDVAVERCQAGPPGSGLLEATVRFETGSAEIELPELHCGAFVPGTDEVLFLNAAAGGSRRIPPHSTGRLRAQFPGDARHTECRCVVADVRRLEGGDLRWREIESWASDFWRRMQREERRAPRVFARRGVPERDAEPDALGLAGSDLPFSTLPALRREWITRANVPIRPGLGTEPSALRLMVGQPVDVLGVDAGVKQVRLASGRTGWIDGDASSPQRQAPPDLQLALDALATSGHHSDASFCRDRSDALQPLVFALLPEDRTVYVTAEWYRLDGSQQDAFQVWARECYGIGRIVEVERGQELRSHAWGDRPKLRFAADPEPAPEEPAPSARP